MAKRSTTSTLLASTILLVGCGSAPEPAAMPEPPPAAAPPPSPEPPPAEAAPATPPAETAAPPPAPPPAVLKDVIGKVAKIEVREVELGAGVKSTRSYSKAADIDAILKAVGVDQAATGPKRRCPDTVQVVFLDEAGAEKGLLGLCGGLGAKDELQGAEFGATMSDRGGLSIADAAALKKALNKAPPSAPKKAAGKEPEKK